MCLSALYIDTFFPSPSVIILVRYSYFVSVLPFLWRSHLMNPEKQDHTLCCTASIVQDIIEFKQTLMEKQLDQFDRHRITESNIDPLPSKHHPGQHAERHENDHIRDDNAMLTRMGLQLTQLASAVFDCSG